MTLADPSNPDRAVCDATSGWASELVFALTDDVLSGSDPTTRLAATIYLLSNAWMRSGPAYRYFLPHPNAPLADLRVGVNRRGAPRDGVDRLIHDHVRATKRTLRAIAGDTNLRESLFRCFEVTGTRATGTARERVHATE